MLTRSNGQLFLAVEWTLALGCVLQHVCTYVDVLVVEFLTWSAGP